MFDPEAWHRMSLLKFLGGWALRHLVKHVLPVMKGCGSSTCSPLLSPPRCSQLRCQPEDARQVKISSPVLNAAELRAIGELPGFVTVTLRTLFSLDKGPDGLHVSITERRRTCRLACSMLIVCTGVERVARVDAAI